jgi:CHAT domain-containing protein
MSSYSPSIKAIVHGRQSPAPTTKSTAPDQALLVAIPDAPSLPMLGHANEEVAVLQTLLESGPLALRAIQPGRSKHDIISKLPSCNIFHFAGHGKTDYRSPIQSSLCLEDWETDPLTVDTLLKLNLHKSSPFLAYLSACGTGDISDEKFLDESIHLTSACQLAGFRHVIGTLWEVDDQACVDIARITYEEMGRKGMTDESVCLGLHKAIRWFRDNESSVVTASGRDWDETDHIRDAGDEVGLERNAARVHRKARIPEEVPLHWVPYVHFGV